MIVVTGASGFVGGQLVPRLALERPILLVSDDTETLRARFPAVNACDYESLVKRDLTGAVFIHLAARNNDRPGTPAEFDQGNIDHLLKVASIARQSGAALFINLCTTHALDPKAGDLYGRSKHEGARCLAAYWPAGAINLYAPAIYGDEFRGKLAKLKVLPAILRPRALALLKQLKPLVSIDHLGQELLRLAASNPTPLDGWRTEYFLADPIPATGLFVAIKRVIDVMAALAVLILAGWVMALIALYIRLDSDGPAIFAQPRVGRHGRLFTCYKFRTMAVDTPHAATHQVSVSSVTRAGAFLRRTKLDELPQIANIFLNQMALVGPRPCLPVQGELIERRLDRKVLDMKPGITGLAQINDIDMSDPARLAAWDSRYGAFRTLYFDIAILIRTLIGGGAGDRVSTAAR